MDKSVSLRRAREAMRQRVAAQRFTITWRAGGSEANVPVERVLQVLDIGLPSLRVLLSKGQGAQQWMRTNPLTGEPDIVVVARQLEPPKPKAKRGRPPKQRRIIEMP